MINIGESENEQSVSSRCKASTSASREEHAQGPVYVVDFNWGSQATTVSTFPEIPTPQQALDVRRKVLLLGMVKAEEFRTNVMGQEGRDRTRIDAMEKLGWNVYTSDDKHPQAQKRLERVAYKKSTKLVRIETELPQHCDTNFAMRGFFTDIRTRFGTNIKFDAIALDYFFSPQGYVQDRWLDDFFKKTLPEFVIECMLNAGSCVWIPHIPYTAKKLQEFRYQIEQVYIVEYVSNPNMNPLFYASGLADTTERLLLFPEKLINDNQLSVLNAGTPFISLTSRGQNYSHFATRATDHDSNYGQSSSSNTRRKKRQR